MRKICPLIALAALAILWTTAAAAPKGTGTEAGATGVSKLGRSWQPLIIKGAKLKPLVGARIASFEVLAIRAGRLAPIPFQVDEVLPDGRYALPSGPEPLADDSPGILDDDDEMVMMISDLGERATDTATLPPGAVEIAMIDPLSGERRYAYAAAVAKPELSPVDYVDYDDAKHQVESDHYRLGFTNELPTDYAPQSRKHEGRPNLIDRIKVRASAKILAGLIPFHLTEGDIRNRELAYRDGPVRVVRRLSHSVRLLLGIRSPQVASDDFFYRDFIENPFHVRLPWVPRLLFGDIVVQIYLDFIDLHGFRMVWSGMKDGGIEIGDQRSQATVIDDPPPVDWIGFIGGGRVMVHTLTPTPDLRVIQRRLYYHDDLTPRPPENYPGEHPGVGYTMTGWENLSRGEHIYNSILLSAPEGFNPGDVLRELSVAPMVEVHPVAAR